MHNRVTSRLASLSSGSRLRGLLAVVLGGVAAAALTVAAEPAPGGSCTFSCPTGPTTATIFGTVFNDANGNGVQDGSEGGLAGFTVFVDRDGDGALGDADPSGTSDGSGRYRFGDIAPGTYTVRQVPRPGFRCTAPAGCAATVELGEGERPGPNFGNVASSTVSGTVFEDANGNGTPDAGEGGVPGATVFVDANGNGTADAGEKQTTTDAAGNWAIADVSPGTFAVREVPPAGFTCTTPAGCAHTLDLSTSRTGVLFGNRRSGGGGTGPPIGGPTAPPAVRGDSVQIGEVRGDIFVMLPAGRSARAAQAGFRPLRQLANIPIGSIIRSNAGVVRLTAAEGAGSTNQRTVLVTGGQFQILQPARRGAPAEMRLNGGSFRASCTSKARAAGSRRTVRRVRATTRGRRGRFRTRGRYSSATVRGTEWTTTDRCDGTLTSVRRGSVTVRDLARNRTIRLAAGRRYLARPR